MEVVIYLRDHFTVQQTLKRVKQLERCCHGGTVIKSCEHHLAKTAIKITHNRMERVIVSRKLRSANVDDAILNLVPFLHVHDKLIINVSHALA
jgi:hypothetical protein